MSGNNSLMDNVHFKEIFGPLIQKCEEEMLSQPYPDDGNLYCNATIDRFGGCWNYTMAGTEAKIYCPPLPGFRTDETATRFCTEQGEWWKHQTFGFESNFSSCLGYNHEEVPHVDYVHIYVFIGGYAISLTLLILSLFVFFRYRQLRCDRITIHKNLFISYILTGLVMILYFVLVALNGDVLFENPIWCRALHVIAQYFSVCNFAWMFCEALYIHTIMVKAFGSGKWLLISCYVIGWNVPCLLTGIYAGLRATSEDSNHSCWNDESSLQWIMNAPIVVSMIVNFIFLCHIVRLLVTKLRQIPEAAQTRKATRATLILILLLGLHFLLLPMRPPLDSPLLTTYLIIAALVTSLQGAFVSVVYCFCNSEVRSLLKRKWYQHRVMVTEKRTASTVATTSYALVDHSSAVHTTVT